jgi:hypothetical protein
MAVAKMRRMFESSAVSKIDVASAATSAGLGPGLLGNVGCDERLNNLLRQVTKSAPGESAKYDSGDIIGALSCGADALSDPDGQDGVESEATNIDAIKTASSSSSSSADPLAYLNTLSTELEARVETTKAILCELIGGGGHDIEPQQSSEEVTHEQVARAQALVYDNDASLLHAHDEFDDLGARATQGQGKLCWSFCQW